MPSSGMLTAVLGYSLTSFFSCTIPAIIAAKQLYIYIYVYSFIDVSLGWFFFCIAEIYIVSKALF